MKDWDPPLLNQGHTIEALNLFSASLFAAEAKRMLQNQNDFAVRMRIAELRKSCGVEPQLTTVRVGLPLRYSGASK